MRARRGLAVLLLASTTAAGCGRSPNDPAGSLTGHWTARGIGHSLVFEMSLEQSGDTISGIACGVDGGQLLFRRAPVHGRYPRVSFVLTPDSVGPVAPGVVGLSFSGLQDDTLDIVGASDFGSDLRFTRGSSLGGC